MVEGELPRTPQRVTRKHRILFVDHTAERGGAELALLRLVAALDQTRFEISALLFSDGPLADALRRKGANVTVIPLGANLIATSRHDVNASVARVKSVLELFRYVVRLVAYLRYGGFDLVHVNSLKAGFIGGIAGRLAARVVIWHLHDRIASDYMPSFLARIVSLTIRRVPHFLIANSRATLETVAPYNEARCAVIYPGVVVKSAPECVEMEMEAKRSLIGIVGRISKTKGQDVFLHAAAQIAKTFPRARFQVVGGALFNDQAFELEMRALASSLDISTVVDFTGFVENVGEYVSALDVVVHASTTPEPFGQVAAEGMAAGKPVVAARAGGIPEIVLHEVTGLLVTPGDVDELVAAISLLLNDKKLAFRLAANGRKHVVDKFSIQQTARQVEQVYAQLLEGKYTARM